MADKKISIILEVIDKATKATLAISKNFSKKRKFILRRKRRIR